MTISRLLVVHLVTKLIICGNAKARMVAGDPEPDPSASEGTVAKLAMRQPFVLFKGLTFQKLCLP
uniref:hypothetical protein n=1 Tax=Escherichia coli TaxID=562 RepID=UPI0024B501A3